jgi:hypothetical protein
LTPCQDDAVAGIYALALAGFVQWLAPRYGEVVQGLPAEVRTLRQQALQGGHRRTPDIVANLALGMQYALAYAHDYGALTHDECCTYWERTWRALDTAAQAQHEHQAGEDPVERFRALLSAALTAGLAHVADASTRTAPPAIPEHWGWRGCERRSGEDVEMVWQPQGACIGWLHGDRLYLDPEVSFSVVQRLADSQQAPLPITQQTLWKRIHEQGLLRREAGQQKNQARRTIGGKREYVVDISAILVSETGPSGPTGPHAAQAQQNQQIPLDLFPAWYQRKPVHSAAAQPVHHSQPQSPPLWTDCVSAPGPVFHTKPVHTNGQHHEQNQGGGPEGPQGPEIYLIEEAPVAPPGPSGMYRCTRCGEEMSHTWLQGRLQCVGCSCLPAEQVFHLRPTCEERASVPATHETRATSGASAHGVQTPAERVPHTNQMPAQACPQCNGPLRRVRGGKAVYCKVCRYRALEVVS